MAEHPQQLQEHGADEAPDALLDKPAPGHVMALEHYTKLAAQTAAEARQ
jgi:hypothetical protein